MATIQELEAKLATTQSEVTKKSLQAEIQKLQLQQVSTTTGSEAAKAILLMKEVLEATLRTTPSGGSVDKQEVEKIVKDLISKSKISKDDLSDELKNYLMSSVKVEVKVQTPTSIGPGGKITEEEYSRPLFQKLISDLIAMNNSYLYGGAGTGKTFIAQQIADFMDWEYIELNCNQFTSQLDILGGQTIDGYQRGKLEMAWGNIDEKGNPTAKKGAILCLDELPKIDPNTAGILNAALASVKNYKGGIAPFILNGKNQKIFKGNLMVIATGNVKLNETSTEYEANFKQDLSLQDRFVGSTYEVTADYRYEAKKVMKNLLFLWIALTKLREKIVEMKWTGQAFVSLRIMLNLKETYIVYRQIEDAKKTGKQNSLEEKLRSPKTLQQGIDSFLNLFKPDQIDQLKVAMDYNKFLTTIKQKDLLDWADINTTQEIEEASAMVKRYEDLMKNKIA